MLLLVAMSGAGYASGFEFRLAHVAPIGSTHDIAAREFAGRVQHNSGGRIAVKIFANSSLGTLPELWGQLKNGAIDLFVQDVGAAFMVEPPPKRLTILHAPYLFESQEHFRRFCRSGLFREMMARAEKAGNLRYLGYLGDRAPRGFSTTKRRVSSPGEMTGLKLRVPPVTPFVEAYRAWGASPTPVFAKDIYTSVKTGMVEGIDQDLVSFNQAGYYEFQKYYTAIDYMRSGLGLWINADSWRLLPQALQAVLITSAQQTAVHINSITKRQINEAEAAIRQQGVELIRPEPGKWRKLALPVILRQEERLGEKGLYRKIEAIGLQ